MFLLSFNRYIIASVLQQFVLAKLLESKLKKGLGALHYKVQTVVHNCSLSVCNEPMKIIRDYTGALSLTY